MEILTGASTFTSQYGPFRNALGEGIFLNKYQHEGAETWEELAHTLAFDVCGGLIPKDIIEEIAQAIATMKFVPGGRYLYYAGRPNKYFNNCFLFRAEDDTREEWSDLMWRNSSALLSGGGTGNNYSIIREKDALLKRTGGRASGPVSLMRAIDEGGRQWRQGGGRRSALYGLLNWQHPDAYHPDKYSTFGIGHDWITAKDWDNLRVPGAFDQDGNPLTVQKARDNDWSYPAPLECTNISLGYDDEFIRQTFGETQFDLLKNQPDMRSRKIYVDDEFITPPDTFIKNVEMAMRNGEPGFSFDMFEKINETLRNACTEVTSEDDSDVCNLGSLNMSRIDDLDEFYRITELGTIFLLCGTRKAMLPFEKIAQVREKNRRLGLGLMGVHEWLLKRNARYEMTPELQEWMFVYETVSDHTSQTWADRMGVSRPVANRAIAPTGSIGTMVGTTTGIEPIYAVAYIRSSFRGDVRHEEYVIEDIAEQMINRYGLKPDDIETASDLAMDPERRISFQADMQDYVDMAISSTLNLPPWMSEYNNPDLIVKNAKIVARHAPRLRGLTFYPDGSRGGQPLKMVPYMEAYNALHTNEAYDACKSGVCGI